MKKLLPLIILIMLLTILFTACGDGDTSLAPNGDTVDGVTMKTQYENYPKKIEHISVTIYNDTNEDIHLSDFFHLEKKIDGEWNKIFQNIEIVSGKDQDVIVYQDSHGDYSFYIKSYTNKLKTGDYRIAIEYSIIILPETYPSTYNTYWLYAEFSVAKSS